MPTLQIIGQEAVEDQNNQANQRLKQQELQQSAYEKVIQFKQMAQELKLKAKQNDNEEERNRILGLSARLDYLAKTYEVSSKYEDPDAVIRHMIEIAGDDVMKTMTDPLVTSMTSKMKPTAEVQRQLADAAQLNQQAGFLSDVRSQLPGMIRAGRVAIEGGQGASNQPAVNAIQGVPPSNEANAPMAGAAPVSASPADAYDGTEDSGIGWGSMTLSPSGLSINIENRKEQARAGAMKKTAEMRAQKAEGETAPAATIEIWRDATSSAMRANNIINSALNNPEFQNYMGVLGMFGRATAQYLGGEKGRLFRDFMSQSKEMVNIYRKMITGAQASVQELNSYIKQVLGDTESDTYDTFLTKNMIASYTALADINQQIELYRGYDTRSLQKMASRLTAQAESMHASLKERGVDVSSMISGLTIDEAGKDIARVMLASADDNMPVDYYQAQAITQVMQTAARQGTPISLAGARKAVLDSYNSDGR